MWHSVRSGYRSLAGRPIFFVAAILTLTLCIGANSLIFSLIDAVLLRPLPYADASRLVALFETSPSQKTGMTPVAPVRLEEWNRLNRSFTGIAGVYTENLTGTSGPLPERLVCARVSPRFFSVLGVLPLIGRAFTPAEEIYGGPKAALISEEFWRRRFGADPGATAKALRLGGDLYPVAGVLPASFRMPLTNEAVDVWIPAALSSEVMRNRQTRFFQTVARLKDGIAPAAALADLSSVQQGLASQFPATDARWEVALEPLKEATVGGSEDGLLILFAAVGMVLLIGCANVACLLLTRSSSPSPRNLDPVFSRRPPLECGPSTALGVVSGSLTRRWAGAPPLSLGNGRTPYRHSQSGASRRRNQAQLASGCLYPLPQRPHDPGVWLGARPYRHPRTLGRRSCASYADAGRWPAKSAPHPGSPAGRLRRCASRRCRLVNTLDVPPRRRPSRFPNSECAYAACERCLE